MLKIILESFVSLKFILIIETIIKQTIIPNREFGAVKIQDKNLDHPGWKGVVKMYPKWFLDEYFGMGITGIAQGTEKVVDTVAEGTKDTISVAQNVTDKGLDVVAEGGEEIKERAESPIERNQDEEKKIEEEGQNVDTESSFASSLKKTVKGGYCYIGTDRTYRSCVKINPGDVCMSNQIYPTKDICINPNLRR